MYSKVYLNERVEWVSISLFLLRLYDEMCILYVQYTVGVCLCVIVQIVKRAED